MTTPTDGLIWHSTPRATVGLVVSGGVVVDTPPYARRWALHRPAAELLNDPRADTAWIPERRTMTDTMSEQTTDEQGWDGDAAATPAATYPEFPENPANHRFTISFDGRGPMVVVRGNTAADIIAGYQELEQSAAGAAMGNAWASIKAAAAVASGLGATPVPAGAPVAPQGPGAPANFANPQGSMTPPPFGPNVSVPGAPGFQGNAGFQAPPMPPAVQSNTPEYQQNGWYRLNVPFQKKGAFDGIVAQYQVRKGRPTEGGSLSFNKADKSWYVSPQVAGAFGEFAPVPA